MPSTRWRISRRELVPDLILRELEEIETWLTAPVEEALKLQRPLPAGVLKVVARGEKEDAA